MFIFLMNKYLEQAGAELCQAQVKLEVVVVVEFGVEVETCHYQSGGQWWVDGQWDKKEFQPTKIEAPKKLGP